MWILVISVRWKMEVNTQAQDSCSPGHISWCNCSLSSVLSLSVSSLQSPHSRGRGDVGLLWETCASDGPGRVSSEEQHRAEETLGSRPLGPAPFSLLCHEPCFNVIDVLPQFPLLSGGVRLPAFFPCQRDSAD